MVVAVRGWAALKAESNLPVWPRVPERSLHDPPPSWGPDGPGIRRYVWASGGCMWNEGSRNRRTTWGRVQLELPISQYLLFGLFSVFASGAFLQSTELPSNFFQLFCLRGESCVDRRRWACPVLVRAFCICSTLHFWLVCFVFPYTWTRVFSIPKQCVFASVDFLWMFWFNPCVLSFWICSPLFRDTFEMFSASIPLRLEGFFCISEWLCLPLKASHCRSRR